MFSLKSFTLLSLSVLSISVLAQDPIEITAHDYAANGPTAFTACGQQLSAFDISRITAWDQITGGASPQNCGTCLEVCGTSTCEAFLAVDLKGSPGVDIAIPGYERITGELPGRVQGNFSVVDAGRCAGIAL